MGQYDRKYKYLNSVITISDFLQLIVSTGHGNTYDKITSFNDLDSIGYDEDNSFNFPVNPYSQFGQNCHFTPIWYPNGKYVVGAKISQCFCPAGMLTICNNNISININGNAYDDWHIAPEMN